MATDVRDADGQVLATWWLLTDAPADWGSSADVARWYSFRWRIESTFKLLKSAGWDVEEWRQRSGEALLPKLLVAIAGCVPVWQLEARSGASAEWRREILMRLSGRQMKRSQPVTTAGLLAGLWVWQSVRGVAGDHGADTIDRLIADHLPLFAAPPNPKKDVCRPMLPSGERWGLVRRSVKVLSRSQGGAGSSGGDSQSRRR